MQHDISGQNETPHLPNDPLQAGIDPLLNEGAAPALGGQQEAEGLPASLSPVPDEDTLLVVETIALPDAAEIASPEVLAVGIGALEAGAGDLDLALPWYRTRWFFISTGVVAAALASAGTLLLLQGLRQRDRRRFSARQLKPAVRAVSLPSIRLVSSQAQGQMSLLSSQLGRFSRQRVGPLQQQFIRLGGQAQQASRRIPPLQRQVGSSTSSAASRARKQWGSLKSGASTQMSGGWKKAQATTSRATSQMQQNLSSLGTGVSSGITTTGAAVQRGWKLGRIFSIGVGAGAVWASLFTPQSGEITRATLAQTLQRLRTTHE